MTFALPVRTLNSKISLIVLSICFFSCLRFTENKDINSKNENSDKTAWNIHLSSVSHNAILKVSFHLTQNKYYSSEKVSNTFVSSLHERMT